MLQSRLSYAQVGTFSLAAYPYSFKLLWSPVVDALYWRRYGRRKSWIVPIQVCVDVGGGGAARADSTLGAGPCWQQGLRHAQQTCCQARVCVAR